MINNIETIKTCCAGIYKITYENGKIYIGQSQNIKKRLQEHNQRANKKGEKLKYPSDLALVKYDAFAEILEIVTDLNQLDEKQVSFTFQEDIFDQDLVLKSYIELSELYNWDTIDCVANDKMKSVEEIHQEIMKIVRINLEK